MYNMYRSYLCPYCDDTSDDIDNRGMYQCPYFYNQYMQNEDEMDYGMRFESPQAGNSPIVLKDYGPQPFVVNIDEATKQNKNFRTVLWTGKHLQVTLMSIKVGEDIGLEIHPNVDQFIRIEQGQGIFKAGRNKNRLDYQARVYDNFAIMIPAGTWHNIINTGNIPLKVYSIYAPPQHPHGAVDKNKPAE